MTYILDFVRAKLVSDGRPYHIVALHGKTVFEGNLRVQTKVQMKVSDYYFYFLTSRADLPCASSVDSAHHSQFACFLPVAIPLIVRLMALRALPHLRQPLFLQPHRGIRTTVRRDDFHFDTHHFVQRLEREGLNRAQAEGIMSAMAEVIDESIRNMTSNMVTKADHEKVRLSELIPWSSTPTFISAHSTSTA